MAQQTAAKHDRYKVTIREQRPFFILKPVLAPNEQLTADFIREAVRTALVKNCTTVALDISGLAGLTAPVVAVLLESNKDVVDRYGRMVLCGAKPGVEEGLEKAGVPYFMKIVKNESELTAAAPVTDRESAAKAVPPAVVDMLRQEPSSFRAEINGITSAARDKVERFVAQAVTDPPQAPRPQEPVTPNALPVEPVVIGEDEGDEAVIEIAAERTAGESAGIKQADRQARLDSFLK